MREADERLRDFNLLIYLYKANFNILFVNLCDIQIMHSNLPKASLLITGIIGAIVGVVAWKFRQNSEKENDDDSRFGKMFSINKNFTYFQETISIDETPVEIEKEPESEYDEEDEESDYYDEEEDKDEEIRSAIGSIFNLLEQMLQFRKIPEVVTLLKDILFRTNNSAQLVSRFQLNTF